MSQKVFNVSEGFVSHSEKRRGMNAEVTDNTSRAFSPDSPSSVLLNLLWRCILDVSKRRKKPYNSFIGKKGSVIVYEEQTEGRPITNPVIILPLLTRIENYLALKTKLKGDDVNRYNIIRGVCELAKQARIEYLIGCDWVRHECAYYGPFTTRIL